MVYLAVILIWRFGKSHKDHKIKCTPLQAWFSFHTVLKTANLKFQVIFLNKSPNNLLANNFTYMVSDLCETYCPCKSVSLPLVW